MLLRLGLPKVSTRSEQARSHTPSTYPRRTRADTAPRIHRSTAQPCRTRSRPPPTLPSSVRLRRHRHEATLRREHDQPARAALLASSSRMRLPTLQTICTTYVRTSRRPAQTCHISRNERARARPRAIKFPGYYLTATTALRYGRHKPLSLNPGPLSSSQHAHSNDRISATPSTACLQRDASDP